MSGFDEVPPPTDADAPGVGASGAEVIGLEAGRKRRAAKRGGQKPKQQPRSNRAESTEPWESELEWSNYGARPTSVNLELILSNDPAWKDTIAFDDRHKYPFLLAGCPILRGEAPRQFNEKTDYHRSITALCGNSARNKVESSLEPGSRTLKAAIDHVANGNVFDPVVKYLDSLTWDGVPRAHAWLVDFFGAKWATERDLQAIQEIGFRWLISAVSRAYEPGCDAQYVLLLKGKEGLNKSRGVRALFGTAFYSQRLSSISSLASSLEIVSPWCTEIGEMKNFSGKNADPSKDFITRTHEDIIPKYLNYPVKTPRRGIMVANTNNPTPLHSEFGNRRFWTVEVTREANVDDPNPDKGPSIVGSRDQLWAEVVHWYRKGERGYIADPKVNEWLLREQGGNVVSDVWDSMVIEYASGFPFVRVVDVLKDIGVPPERMDDKAEARVKKILTRLKWTLERRRVSGRKAGTAGDREYVWVRPDASDEEVSP